ncbi:MAG: hypothetical protein GF331_16410 [Chitinivibrionales bacterium]|nr:hypothetical protein [Chitinivibrionales bacterium]
MGKAQPTHAAFSPDGKQLAVIVKKHEDTGSVWIMNNDGTGQRALCPTYVDTIGMSFCNICWTERGIFWSERAETIFWADPVSGETRVLGPIQTPTTINHLRIDRAGRHVYARTTHNIPGVGGLFFEINDGLNGLVNERGFAYDHFDHGCCMLNDGSAAIWIPWHCNHYGNEPECTGGHEVFVRRPFDDENAYSFFPPGDNLGDSYELAGPGSGPYTTPNSDNLILYCKTASAEDGAWFIMDITTGESVDVTPSDDRIAPGGAIESFDVLWRMVLGEFWIGRLPSPHATDPVLATDKSSLHFTDDVTPIPSQSVSVTNIGAGTLGTISVTEEPDAPWLSITIGGADNDRSIEAAVSADGLADGSYRTVVTVAGGGATNTRQFSVTLTVGAAVQAPSDLSATLSGDNIALSWTDNADNETGFVIERREHEGSFTQLASTTANVTSYLDDSGVEGTVYEYRVMATDGTGNSSWSAVASVLLPLPPVIVTSPAQGQSFTIGDEIHIMWSTTSVANIQIHLSVNEGETWLPITSSGGITQGEPDWGDVAWVVPERIGDQALGDQANVQIRVSEYQNAGVAGLSGMFAITATSIVDMAHAGVRSHKGVGISCCNDIVTFTAQKHVLLQAEVFSVDGRLVASLGGSNVLRWNTGTVRGGSYVARLCAEAADGTRQVVDMRRITLP